ncbi:MAG: hypothetical protein H6766_01215 [Candidatus Peribacteria bacterium]|nr:MAG: hypothetical protein H6766_01215 [Candidatus Peribacteria bacterium]
MTKISFFSVIKVLLVLVLVAAFLRSVYGRRSDDRRESITGLVTPSDSAHDVFQTVDILLQ